MNKMYISSPVLDGWFNDYDPDEKDWVLPEIIENLCQGLADTNILLVDASDKGDQEKLRNINNAIISALRDLKQLNKEVSELIANGEVLQQGGGKRKGGAA